MREGRPPAYASVLSPWLQHSGVEGWSADVLVRESRSHTAVVCLSPTRNSAEGVGREHYRTSGLLKYRATSYDSHMSASSASFSLRLMEMGRAPLARRGGCGTLVVGWAVSSAASWSSAGSSW